ncbi:MAG: adenylate/guanylate cyclase domain-containing protein, partial [Nitrospiria bacterium]
ITTVPYFELLRSPPNLADDASPVDFKGKVVFIGVSEFLLSEQKDGFDTVFTQPNGLYLSGVEICATAFANLLEDFPIRPLDLSVHLFLILIWGIALGLIWLLLPPVIAMGISALFILFLIGIAYTQFKMAGMWFPLITPIFFQTPFAGFGAVLWNYVDTNRERKMIKEAFGYYLPDTVVDQLSGGLKDLKSGGQLLYGTCLSTDVENYTALSESIPPEDLRSLMNDYYEGILAPVKKYGGIPIDVKGDSALVIWAASDPDARLRVQACLAALEIGHAVDRFNQSPGGPKLHTRIGVHSGEVSLGNVGGGHHLEYTAMGDMVNTASRIEGLNKYLGTRLLASQETLADLGDFLTRDLGTFFLAGKFRSVAVRELIAQLKESNEDKRRLCRDFSTALQLYKMRLWPEAIDVFSKILSENGTDGPSLLYIKHCEQLMQSHPSDSWDGIIRMDQK